MTDYFCNNCKYSFSGEDTQNCPRCSSKKIIIKREAKRGEQSSQSTQQKSFVYRNPLIVGETKSSWAAFHSSEQRECSECHGMEFDIDWKHRQKICKKCGAIYGMKRNH
ncbi:MAG: hypothetical protein ACP5O3_03815 [Candidatus Micrarchaeia archaeon]